MSHMGTVEVVGRIFMKTAVINFLNVAYVVNSKILKCRTAVSRQDVLLQSSPCLEKMGITVLIFILFINFGKVSVENIGISNGQ